MNITMKQRVVYYFGHIRNHAELQEMYCKYLVGQEVKFFRAPCEQELSL